ncbi:MAG: hypothetical protein JST30_05780 [Armatimonadetes bacterium]|nr:hypothetical protein [Armatimonadota bacterium]
MGDVVRSYVPLAVSWIMMAAEAPVCTGTVNSLPDHRVQLAALQVVFAMALFIESPVIDLLATSTTLAGSRSDYQAIRKFTGWLMAWTFVFHFVLSATPVFTFVFETVLRQTTEVAEAARIPMLILLPWSPAIGWRRHVQGLLIRNGTTRPIGFGTLVRISTITLVSVVGFASKGLKGAEVAAVALSCSVVAEAVYIHFAGRRALATVLWRESGGGPLDAKALLRFHLPLSLSTMAMLTTLPMVSWALNKSPEGILAMNSWQVALGLAFLFRTMTFALPEIVISNWHEGSGAKLLSRFCLGIGAGLSALMLLMSATGLDRSFFSAVIRADADVASGAHQAFLWSSALPLLSAATSYTKGVLTAEKVTVTRAAATVASVGVLISVLQYGVTARWPGVVTASAAVTASQAAEFAVLAGFMALRARKPTAIGGARR